MFLSYNIFLLFFSFSVVLFIFYCHYHFDFFLINIDIYFMFSLNLIFSFAIFKDIFQQHPGSVLQWKLDVPAVTEELWRVDVVSLLL